MIFPKLIPARNQYSLVHEYELCEELACEPTPDSVFLLPPFFSFDGASIPWMGWQIIYSPNDPIVMGPALPHDWFYLTHLVSREIADEMLRRELIQNGAPVIKANIIYDAVRQFGGSHWENSLEDEKYAAWLKQKLTNEGLDPARYRLA